MTELRFDDLDLREEPAGTVSEEVALTLWCSSAYSQMTCCTAYC